ncbi:PAAR domain-containing protein [Rhizobium leguminosarum]|nr:PAAR domain-containing protein [Rhizobium leguminosarum]
MVEPGPKPHVGGPISETQTLVTVEGVPVAVVGDKCTCVVAGPDTISGGSSIVFIEGNALARIGDGGRVVEGLGWFTSDYI